MLQRFVSNTDKKVYALLQLPEEVVAVIFAYVSRSPRSFRENLVTLLEEEQLGLTNSSDKAAAFHQKWVIQYGHSSVAEHAVVHLGLEDISRIASAELALANTFHSITEYSQRYQTLIKPSYYTPVALHENTSHLTRFHALQKKSFAIYQQLQDDLLLYLQKTDSPRVGEKETARLQRLRKWALEDARYALTLATHTHLGLTANGRSLRDTLVQLLSSPYEECQGLAKQMEEEARAVLPTLLRYVQKSEYQVQSRQAVRQILASRIPEYGTSSSFSFSSSSSSIGPEAYFVQMPAYAQALQEITALAQMREGGSSWQEAKKQVRDWVQADCEAVVEALLHALPSFAHPDPLLGHLQYHASLTLSEANWHQLLRHNRKIHFTSSPPDIRHGWTAPPRVKEAGREDLLREIVEEAEEVYEVLCCQEGPTTAAYCVTNAHRRQVMASCSLWELYHLINLRTASDAQWDIQAAVTQLQEELQKKQPLFARYAQRRS